MHEHEYYVIEGRNKGYGDFEYRFRSLFNDCVGSWKSFRDDAIKQGEAHARLIERYFNACATTCGVGE